MQTDPLRKTIRWAVKHSDELLRLNVSSTRPDATHLRRPHRLSSFRVSPQLVYMVTCRLIGCCILAILFDGMALRRFFEWTPLRWIGLISYSLYIWHLPLLNAFQQNIGLYLTSQPHLGAYSLYWVWVAAVVLPFSLAVYQLIEKPGTRLSNRLQKRQSRLLETLPVPREPELVDLAAPQISHI